MEGGLPYTPWGKVAWVHRIKQAVFAAIMVAGLAALAAPAGAQMFSDGFKFLKAVDEKDRRTVIELVNKNKTIIDARDLAKGHTALHIAVQRRDLAWIDYLLGLNANSNIADKQGVTAVHRRDMALLRVLLRAGADPDRKDNSGRSARDYAALDGANNVIVNEINRLANASKKEKPAQTYGPSL